MKRGDAREWRKKELQKNLERAQRCWRSLLASYGPDGEGPRIQSSELGVGEMSRALTALLFHGSSATLPKGSDPAAAAFAMGKALGCALEARDPPSGVRPVGAGSYGPEAQKGLDALAGIWEFPNVDPQRALDFISGARCAWGADLKSALFALLLKKAILAGDAQRMAALVDEGVSAEATVDEFFFGFGPVSRANASTHPLALAFKARSEACVQALLERGCDPAGWAQTPYPPIPLSSNLWMGLGALHAYGAGMGRSMFLAPSRAPAPERSAELALGLSAWRALRQDSPALRATERELAAGWEALCARSHPEEASLAQSWELKKSVGAVELKARARPRV